MADVRCSCGALVATRCTGLCIACAGIDPCTEEPEDIILGFLTARDEYRDQWAQHEASLPAAGSLVELIDTAWQVPS